MKYRVDGKEKLLALGVYPAVTGNKEHQQIIEHCEAFVNAYGMSRFAPLDYDPRDLPIHELYGYRDKGGDFNEPVLFYVLPTPFKNEVAKGFIRIRSREFSVSRGC